MEICIITSAKFPPEEGIGNYIYNMSKMLIANGHRVTVITRGGLSKTVKSSFEGITLYRVTFVPLYPFYMPFHSFFVKRLFRSIEPNFDIVHFHTPLPPVINTHLPVMTTVHTPMKTDIGNIEVVNLLSVLVKLQGKISVIYENQLFKRSDQITSVASSVSQELSEYGLDPKSVKVLGNGVNHYVFHPIPEKSGEKYILFTGRLTYRKGLFDFIESAKIICGRHADVNIKIVGKGPLLETLREMARASGFENRFAFLGHVEKETLIRLYQNATIFVVPSHYEGLPTTLLEAMACGAPVVATAVSGNLDVITTGKNGLLVSIKSPVEMADAVSKLLDDEHMRNEMGLEARCTIEERFTWEAITGKICECYETLYRAKGTCR